MRTLIVALAVLWQANGADVVFTDYLEAAAYLEGAQSPENLSEEDYEKYCDLHIHPLRLNSSSASDLASTGFFTPFQVSSLLDYISRNGDILSAAELSCVSGIGREMASALSFFVSFESGRLPSQRRHAGKEADISASMCNSVKNTGISSRFKSTLTASKGWSGGLCYTDALQSAYLKRSGAKADVLAGSFNARFGQGLTFSGGFSMSGVQSISSLSRNPSGITPSTTSNSAYAFSGAAAVFRLGRVTLQSLSTFDLSTQAINLACYTNRSTGSLTFSRSDRSYSLGADFKSTVGCFTLWGEASASVRDKTLGSAALAGAYYNIAYKRRLALMFRAYSPSYANPYASAVHSTSKCCDQMALDLGVEYDNFSALLDIYRKTSTGDSQARLISVYHCGAIECRLDSRFIGVNRHSVRVTGTSVKEDLSFSARIQVQRGESWAGLAYFQAGWKSPDPSCKTAATLKITWFHAPVWNDRLYGYSPDVPGFFSVKTYYGRGLESAIYLRVKELALKIGRTDYFDGKPSKYEVRLLVSFRNSVSIPRPKR